MDEEKKDKENIYKLPEDKVEDLKSDLKQLGYDVQETEDGEIKVTN